MIRVGFIGRTKMLFDAIRLFGRTEGFEVAFVWTCRDEEYYEFGWENFKRIAKQFNCPFFYHNSVDISEDIPAADLVISMNFVNLIPLIFIERFGLGVLNAHPGDLPRYKGNACPNWAILNGEDEVVLSIHKMDEGLDSGPIILKEKFQLTSDTYIGEIYNWLEDTVPRSFLEAAFKLHRDFVPSKQVGRTLRTFPRKPEDSRLDFKASVDWNYRIIRASSKPLSGAFCYLNNSDLKVTILEANPVQLDYDFIAVRGQIIERYKTDSSFLVVVGEGVLKVTKYSVNGLSKEESYDIVCRSLRNRLN